VFEIRDAVESDRTALVQMYLQDVENEDKKARAFAEALLNGLNTLVCIQETRVLGSLSWDIRGGVEDGVIELVSMGVTEDFRRQGVGRALVQAMKESATECFAAEGQHLRFIYLFMEKENQSARKFYRSVGFREVCTIPTMYPHGDACVWTQSVAGSRTGHETRIT
jgi:ribosomal protein S18 acetylase RimI-like enzyme